MLSLKHRWQKHHSELAQHKPKAYFVLWNGYFSLSRLRWKRMYRHLHQLEYVIAMESVWMISVPVVSLAVSNSYFTNPYLKIVSSFSPYFLASTLPVVLVSFLGMSYSSWCVSKQNTYMILSAWGLQIVVCEQVTAESERAVWSLVYNPREPAIPVRKCHPCKKEGFGVVYRQNLRIMDDIKVKKWEIPCICMIHKILVVFFTGAVMSAVHCSQRD